MLSKLQQMCQVFIWYWCKIVPSLSQLFAVVALRGRVLRYISWCGQLLPQSCHALLIISASFRESLHRRAIISPEATEQNLMEGCRQVFFCDRKTVGFLLFSLYMYASRCYGLRLSVLNKETTLWVIKKTRHFYFLDNTDKYWPIFVFFSLLYTQMNCG